MRVFASCFVLMILAVSQWIFLFGFWFLGANGVVELSSEGNPGLHGAVLSVTILLLVLCVVGNLVLLRTDRRLKAVFLISIGVGVFGWICALISIPAIIEGI